MCNLEPTETLSGTFDQKCGWMGSPSMLVYPMKITATVKPGKLGVPCSTSAECGNTGESIESWQKQSWSNLKSAFVCNGSNSSGGASSGGASSGGASSGGGSWSPFRNPLMRQDSNMPINNSLKVNLMNSVINGVPPNYYTSQTYNSNINIQHDAHPGFYDESEFLWKATQNSDKTWNFTSMSSCENGKWGFNNIFPGGGTGKFDVETTSKGTTLKYQGDGKYMSATLAVVDCSLKVYVSSQSEPFYWKITKRPLNSSHPPIKAGNKIDLSDTTPPSGGLWDGKIPDFTFWVRDSESINYLRGWKQGNKANTTVNGSNINTTLTCEGDFAGGCATPYAETELSNACDLLCNSAANIAGVKPSNIMLMGGSSNLASLSDLVYYFDGNDFANIPLDQMVDAVTAAPTKNKGILTFPSCDGCKTSGWTRPTGKDGFGAYCASGNKYCGPQISETPWMLNADWATPMVPSEGFNTFLRMPSQKSGQEQAPKSQNAFIGYSQFLQELATRYLPVQAKNRQCPSEYFYSDGKCVPMCKLASTLRNPEGFCKCSTDADCMADQTCVNGVCNAKNTQKAAKLWITQNTQNVGTKLQNALESVRMFLFNESPTVQNTPLFPGTNRQNMASMAYMYSMASLGGKAAPVDIQKLMLGGAKSACFEPTEVGNGVDKPSPYMFSTEAATNANSLVGSNQTFMTSCLNIFGGAGRPAVPDWSSGPGGLQNVSETASQARQLQQWVFDANKQFCEMFPNSAACACIDRGKPDRPWSKNWTTAWNTVGGGSSNVYGVREWWPPCINFFSSNQSKNALIGTSSNALQEATPLNGPTTATNFWKKITTTTCINIQTVTVMPGATASNNKFENEIQKCGQGTGNNSTQTTGVTSLNKPKPPCPSGWGQSGSECLQNCKSNSAVRHEGFCPCSADSDCFSGQKCVDYGDGKKVCAISSQTTTQSSGGTTQTTTQNGSSATTTVSSTSDESVWKWIENFWNKAWWSKVVAVIACLLVLFIVFIAFKSLGGGSKPQPLPTRVR